MGKDGFNKDGYDKQGYDKDGFVHSYAYFEILSKKMCIHCGDEEQ